MFTQGQGWIMDIVRSLIAWIDTIGFVIVKYILVIIFDMANYEMPFDRLQGIYDRMFVLISVFMVFKLSFTFFQYLMNPDRMSDSKTGLPKLFRNTMIMIVLMIFLPMVFTGRIGSKDGKSFIIRLQNAAIPTLTRVLLGTDGAGAGQSGQQTSQKTVDTSVALADEITLAVAQCFIHHSIGAKELCRNYREQDLIHELTDIPQAATVDCRISGALWWGNDVYVYSYTYILPLIVAGFMGYILIRMAIAVGKRVFKLMILEIITPIPVMSLINPQALEKGDSPFMAWLHSLISTFLEIFFQLAILYLFIIFIDVVITDSVDKIKAATSALELARVALVTIALVLSLLFFAGEAPGFLKKALGIKDSGDDMGAIMGAALGGAAGAMLGGAAGLVQGLKNGSGMRGLAEGARTGFQNGSKAKSISDQIGSAHAGGEAAAQAVTDNKNYHTGFAGFLGRSSARNRGLNGNNLWNMGQQKKELQARAAEAATDVSNASIDLDKFKSTYSPGYTGTCSFTGQDGTTYSGSYDMLLQQLSDNKMNAESAKADADTALQKVETDEKTLKGKMEAAGLNTNMTPMRSRVGATRNEIRYAARQAATHTGNATWNAMAQAAIDTQIGRGGTKVANQPNPTSSADPYGYNNPNNPTRI